MAVFDIQWGEGRLPGPTYEDYTVQTNNTCGQDVVSHPIKFDDIATGDYIVGYNWMNTYYNLQVGSIKILSFSDITTVTDSATGNSFTANLPSNTLKDNSTGNQLTYPYTTSINNLFNIVEINNQSTELVCQDGASNKFMNKRARVIEYVLLDTGGNVGPTRYATYINIGPQ